MPNVTKIQALLGLPAYYPDADVLDPGLIPAHWYTIVDASVDTGIMPDDLSTWTLLNMGGASVLRLAWANGAEDGPLYVQRGTYSEEFGVSLGAWKNLLAAASGSLPWFMQPATVGGDISILRDAAGRITEMQTPTDIGVIVSTLARDSNGTISSVTYEIESVGTRTETINRDSSGRITSVSIT